MEKRAKVNTGKLKIVHLSAVNFGHFNFNGSFLYQYGSLSSIFKEQVLVYKKQLKKSQQYHNIQ